MLQLSFVNFRKDSYILVEGKNDSDKFYIIKTGNVKCFKMNDPNNISTKTLGPGDFVGVIPCMSGHSQIENVVALTDVSCISVRKDQYSELIEKNTSVALKIIRTFAHRVRSMNEQLTQLALNSISIDSPEHIFDVAEYYERVRRTDIAAYAYNAYLRECPQGIKAFDAEFRLNILRSPIVAQPYTSHSELIRSYKKDTMIFSESQSGSDMFIIQDGVVSISKVVDGNEVTLAMLKRGDMFGEMALLENKPRSASAIAHEDCRLMVVNRQNFDQMVGTQPQLISRLTTMLSERLWSMYRHLDNACLRDYQHKMIDMLALQLEKNRKYSGPYQSDISVMDLATMCVIPQHHLYTVTSEFQSNGRIKIVNGKIYVPDCLEVLKQSAFCRKQKSE
ncbi:MAG: cyclic nucleotide-binding domain-containing protein [Treponema sp.]|nr:cyclic nucleotide-binding domain-containing protein [Treponema sp.]MBQ1972481.1 cyclic nucleotide-binding domain-containing protein [Treponema sp.]MBQ5647179.1 cyclic nucleotide-binding domain-containing protein [Treponema sp.]MBQ5847694.1 cyclic nucleotide-binding domain-containing protein [Treponema sp.]MBQ5877868.1 cyclic nucleotide-binding domain-containing protein [Treponema sp.]